MYGAIIGDLAGSIYEFDQTKNTREIKPRNILEKDAFYSDDTILTIATLDSILENKSYEEMYKKYYQDFKNYKPSFEPYFKGTFSPGFSKWAEGKKEGNSTGNGALMRLSPIPFIFDNTLVMYIHLYDSINTSHNSDEARGYALCLADFIRKTREVEDREKLLSLSNEFKYTPFTKFNTTCKETLPNVLYAVLTSKDFEEAILKTVSMGGDTDTNAAIAGSIAEGLFGIPDSLIRDTNKYLPPGFVKKLEKGYRLVKSK